VEEGGRNRPVIVIAAKTGKRDHGLMRRVVIVTYPGVQTLDVTGPAEVFRSATAIAGDGGYELEPVAPSPGPLPTSSVPLFVERRIADCHGPIDTLIVAGGTGSRPAQDDPELIDWLRAAAARSRRVTSVCTGALILARAGLLDGRRATTHWAWCDYLASRYPAVRVEPRPIFVRDGNVATSAGVTAGMDLALALVEEDLGPEVALEVARWLVLFLRRPGGQSQFSAQLAAQTAERAPLRELQAWIPDHLAEDLSVPALARRACMSERNFARAFRRETGRTPAAYVEAARVERARIGLESGDLPVDALARQVGFGTVETLRRAFRRRLGVSPADYRSRFRPRTAA
jgi:transcriptional regulator GlxA family with amidase domain